jgi:hypothetical protein
MALEEVPSELFLLLSAEQLWLHLNVLCSLPSGIGQLKKLVFLDVRRPPNAGWNVM